MNSTTETTRRPQRAGVAFARALITTNFKAAIAHRAAFWLQLTMMACNNAIWLFVWFLFFRQFRHVGGWQFADMVALYGIIAIAYGFSMTITGGVREIARKIEDGDLDPLLTQPKSVLLQVSCSETVASGWGDLVSGTIMLIASGALQPSTIPVAAVVVPCATLIYISAQVLIHCTAFWFSAMPDFARQFGNYLVTLAIYPQTIYQGWLKLTLFTIVPAGLMGFLPVELLRRFDVIHASLLVAATAIYTLAAHWVFSRGLRRYESGSKFQH